MFHAQLGVFRESRKAQKVFGGCGVGAGTAIAYSSCVITCSGFMGE